MTRGARGLAAIAFIFLALVAWGLSRTDVGGHRIVWTAGIVIFGALAAWNLFRPRGP